MTKVINLFAGPGSGKSTTAAGLFFEMKMRSMNVELATEYAKDLTWHDRFKTLGDQYYVFGKQHHRIFMLQGKVDYVITDSPIIMGQVYADDYPDCFYETVNHAFNQFDNINFYIDRVKPYNPAGRSQTENGAKLVDQKIIKLLNKNNVDYKRVQGDRSGMEKILRDIILWN